MPTPETTTTQLTESEVEQRERVATPPVSINCAICGETIYLSLDKWYHLNSGGRRCPPKLNNYTTGNI